MKITQSIERHCITCGIILRLEEIGTCVTCTAAVERYAPSKEPAGRPDPLARFSVVPIESINLSRRGKIPPRPGTDTRE